MNRGMGFWNKTVKKEDSWEVKSQNYKLDLSVFMEEFTGFDCQGW